MVLNACSQHIANIIFTSNKKLKIVNILELLRTEHDVFKKLSYRNFRHWYNDFIKNYDEYQKSYLANAEFFQKANEYAKSIKIMRVDAENKLNRIIDVTPKTASTDRIADMSVVRPALNDAVAVLDLPEKIDPYQDLLKIGVPAPKLPLTPLTIDDPKFPFYFREGDEVTGLFYDANGIIFDKFTSNEESKMLPVTKNLKFVLELEGENICWNYDYQQFSSIFTKTYTSSDLLEFYRTKNRSYIMSNSDCFHKI